MLGFNQKYLFLENRAHRNKKPFRMLFQPLCVVRLSVCRRHFYSNICLRVIGDGYQDSAHISMIAS